MLDDTHTASIKCWLMASCRCRPIQHSRSDTDITNYSMADRMNYGNNDTTAASRHPGPITIADAINEIITNDYNVRVNALPTHVVLCNTVADTCLSVHQVKKYLNIFMRKVFNYFHKFDGILYLFHVRFTKMVKCQH